MYSRLAKFIEMASGATNLHRFTCFHEDNVGTNQIKQLVKLTSPHVYT